MVVAAKKTPAPPASSSATAGAAGAAGGGGGTSAGETAYTTENLHHRLLAGLGNKGGARGSLTRCAGRLGTLRAAVLRKRRRRRLRQLKERRRQPRVSKSPSGGNDVPVDDPSAGTDENHDDDDGPDDDDVVVRARDDLLREIELMKIDLRKTCLVMRRLEEEIGEIVERGSPLDRQIEEEQESVRRLRDRLREASWTAQCQQEYETLAKLAASRHPTPRRVLQGQMDQIQADLKEAESGLRTATAQVQIRTRQFQLLMQCMLDLKQSLDEPLEILRHERVRDGKAGADEGGDDRNDPDAMDVEPNKGNNNFCSHEDDLYGDL